MADTITIPLPPPNEIDPSGTCLYLTWPDQVLTVTGHPGAGLPILLHHSRHPLSAQIHITIEDARQLAADLLTMCDAVEQAERKAAADTDATELLDQKKGDPC